MGSMEDLWSSEQQQEVRHVLEHLKGHSAQALHEGDHNTNPSRVQGVSGQCSQALGVIFGVVLHRARNWT